MLNKIEQFIEEHRLFSHASKILVAVSGGRDSIALLYSLHRLGYNITAAHCNFHLRGEESNRDQKFVQSFCENLSPNVPLYIKDFDTESFAKQKGISIEMAARELRYDWFEELRSTLQCDYIAVAHHSDDVIETFLINIARGTGLQGLTGIKPKQGKVVRPLLSLSRNDITQFIADFRLQFVDDSTNFESVYLRNKMRNIIIPALEQSSANFKKSLLTTIENLNDANNFNAYYLGKLRERLVSQKENEIVIDACELISHPHSNYILFELLKPYSFSPKVCKDIFFALYRKESQSSSFYSPKGYCAIIDRKKLLVRKINDNFASGTLKSEEIYRVEQGVCEIITPIHLKLSSFSSEEYEIVKEPCICGVDADKLKFPLCIRHWKRGDVFFPFGMKGKKKLSDFFTDCKLSMFEKNDVWLLTSGDDIVWVVGMRSDNRFRIDATTKNILQFELVI